MAGAVLFRDKGCAHCHGEGGIGGKKGPPLVDIEKDKQWTPEKITNQILNGGQKMPPFADSLTDAEVAHIAATTVGDRFITKGMGWGLVEIARGNSSSHCSPRS